MFDHAPTPSGGDRPLLLVGLAVTVELRGGALEPRLDAPCGTPHLGHTRILGWSDALRGGHAARVVVVGGTEAIPAAGAPRGCEAFALADGCRQVPRGWANVQGMIRHHAAPAARCEWRVSPGNTLGNMEAVRRILEEEGARFRVAVSTGFAHLPRAAMCLHRAGLGAVPIVPAEAFTLAAAPGRAAARAALEHDLGGGPLARRAALAINRTADLGTGCCTLLPTSGGLDAYGIRP